MRRNISIVPRLVGPVIGGGTLIGVVVFAIVFRFVNNGFETAERRELHAVYKNVTAEIDALRREALAMSAPIAGMPTVQQAMAARDRKTLTETFVPGFSTLKSDHKVRQFQFHLPPATSFLRIHNPQKFGDDLSGFRKTVVQTNSTSSPVRGLGIGVAGLGVRGVVPVRAEGQHVGSVEMGMSFGQAFFAEYSKAHDVKIALLLA